MPSKRSHSASCLRPTEHQIQNFHSFVLPSSRKSATGCARSPPVGTPPYTTHPVPSSSLSSQPSRHSSHDTLLPSSPCHPLISTQRHSISILLPSNGNFPQRPLSLYSHTPQFPTSMSSACPDPVATVPPHPSCPPPLHLLPHRSTSPNPSPANDPFPLATPLSTSFLLTSTPTSFQPVLPPPCRSPRVAFATPQPSPFRRLSLLEPHPHAHPCHPSCRRMRNSSFQPFHPRRSHQTPPSHSPYNLPLPSSPLPPNRSSPLPPEHNPSTPPSSLSPLTPPPPAFFRPLPLCSTRLQIGYLPSSALPSSPPNPSSLRSFHHRLRSPMQPHPLPFLATLHT